MKHPLWLSLIALALLNAWAQSHSVPRSDDLIYLAWAADHGNQWWAPLTELTAFPNWRPAVFAIWWLCVWLSGVSGLAVQGALVGLWGVALGAWSAWVFRRWGEKAALWTAFLLLCTGSFRDLLTWRSWLTTTGELACAGLALLALEYRWKTAGLLLGVLACAFKEPAALLVGGIAWQIYGERRIFGMLLLAVVPSAIFLLYWNANDSIWAIGPRLLAAAEVGWSSGWPVLVLLGVGSLPRKWAIVLGLTLVLPLFYPHANATYFSETLIVGAGLGGVWLSRKSVGAMAVLGVLVLAVPGLVQSAKNIRYQWERNVAIERIVEGWEEQRPAEFYLEKTAGEEAKYLTLQLWWTFNVPVATKPVGVEIFPGLWIAE